MVCGKPASLVAIHTPHIFSNHHPLFFLPYSWVEMFAYLYFEWQNELNKIDFNPQDCDCEFCVCYKYVIIKSNTVLLIVRQTKYYCYKIFIFLAFCNV